MELQRVTCGVPRSQFWGRLYSHYILRMSAMFFVHTSFYTTAVLTTYRCWNCVNLMREMHLKPMIWSAYSRSQLRWPATDRNLIQQSRNLCGVQPFDDYSSSKTRSWKCFISLMTMMGGCIDEESWHVLRSVTYDEWPRQSAGMCLLFFNFGELNLYAVYSWHGQQSSSWTVSLYLELTTATSFYLVPEYQLYRVLPILNVAAHLIYGHSRYHNVTDLLRNRLHWLCFPERTAFKCCLLVYKTVHGLAPSHITDFCTKTTSFHCRLGLQSDARDELVVPRTKSKSDDSCFSASGPATWNALPQNIRSAKSVDIFKSRLKLHLFGLSYDR